MEGLDFVVREDADFWICTNLEEHVVSGTEVTNILDIVNDKSEGHARLVRGVGLLGDHGRLYLGGAALHGHIIQDQTFLKPTNTHVKTFLIFFPNINLAESRI